MIDSTQIMRATVAFLVLASAVAYGFDGIAGVSSVLAGGAVVLSQLASSMRRVRSLITPVSGRMPFLSPTLLISAAALYYLVPLVHPLWLVVGLSSVVNSIALLGLKQASVARLAVPVEVS